MGGSEPARLGRHVVVVGAGISGLTAARTLQDAGVAVTVLDKGRGVGGRLATRRIGEARLDHGAQFFTVRSDEFRHVVDEAMTGGAVREWCRGFASPDGYPRYVGHDGMTALAKHLAAGLDVRTGVRVTDLADHPADGYVLTPPVPQTLAILGLSGRLPVPDIAEKLAAITYDVVLALLVVLDRSPQLPSPGAHQQPDHPLFTFIADNQAKGVSSQPAMTFHVADVVARARWADPDDEVRGDLLAEAAPWLGGAEAVASQLVRWRYSAPRTPWPAPHLVVQDGPQPVVLAGDAFDGPTVERAYRSGRSAAAAVLERLTLGG